MKEQLKRLGAVLTDPFGVQLYFLLFSFAAEIPVAMAYVQFWKKIGLLWAAAVILYDLFTRRRFLKTRFALPVLGLLAAYALTLVSVRVNYPYAFQESYLDWACSAVALLVLYPPATDDREKGLRRLDVLNWLLVGLTTAIALVGLGMFCVQVGGYFHSDITRYDYPVGFVAKRLTGLYRNAIYPTSLIGVMAAVIAWVRLKRRAIGRRLVLAICIASNVLHIVLSNSRGIVYALAMFAALMVFFWLYRRLRQRQAQPKTGTAWLCRWGGSLLLAAVTVVLVLVAVPLIRNVCAYVPARVQQVMGTVESPFPSNPTDQEEPVVEDVVPDDAGGDATESEELLDPNTPIDLDRDTSDSRGVLTGRPIIWRQGWSYFLERPLLGYGSYALKDKIRISETSTERLSHFHNIFLQSLVSVGAIGSVFFFALLLGAAWLVLRGLILRTDMSHYTVLAGVGCMLAALLFLNLADTTIFFLSKNSEFVFWTYLGYALLLTDGRSLKLDAPVRFVDEHLPRLQSL